MAMDILDLTEFKSVKALKAYLKKNSIPLSTKHGLICFEYSFWDTLFTVQANRVNDIIVSFILEMNSATDDYLHSAEKMLEIKDCLADVLEQPKLDNTNHLNMNDIYVKFVKGDILCELFCMNDCGAEFETEHVFICIASNKNEISASKKHKISQPILPLLIISLIGGFFWGLGVYGLLGLALHDFSLSFFGLCMLGGLFFGILLALALYAAIIIDRNPKNNYRKLYKTFDLGNCPDVYKGYGVCRFIDDKGKYHSDYYPTLMQVSDSVIVVHFLIKNKPFSRKIPLIDAFGGLLFDHITFTADNYYFEFVFKDYSAGKQLKDDLSSRFIDRNKYLSLFECLKKAITDYNPYSVYNTNDSGILDNEIGTLTNYFLIYDNLSESELSEMVSNTFSYNDYTDEALTCLLSESFSNWKNEGTYNEAVEN